LSKRPLAKRPLEKHLRARLRASSKFKLLLYPLMLQFKPSARQSLNPRASQGSLAQQRVRKVRKLNLIKPKHNPLTAQNRRALSRLPLQVLRRLSFRMSPIMFVRQVSKVNKVRAPRARRL
jgi:hypothetical protein